MRNQIFHGDCLEIMPTLPDKSVDMILCDLPYGVLGHSWDNIIPIKTLWLQYERLITDRGAIVLTATQPFTSLLISSNLDLFKYCWAWDKGKAGNIYVAKLRPLQVHEDIVVFSKGTIANCSKKLMNYYPQMISMDKPDKYKMYKQGGSFQRENVHSITYVRDKKYPKSILNISNNDQRGKLHPTQKPVALFEYLIKTYTNEGDLILDNCSGSGTTAIAAMNTNRDYICIEKDDKYFELGAKRIAQHQQRTMQLEFNP